MNCSAVGSAPAVVEKSYDRPFEQRIRDGNRAVKDVARRRNRNDRPVRTSARRTRDRDLAWANTMGVPHAGSAQHDFLELAPAAAVAGNAALSPAAAAHRKALAAAIDAAVVATALRRIEAERRATQRRLREIEHHRIPRLASALRALQLQLDETEREERVVTRMARERRATQ